MSLKHPSKVKAVTGITPQQRDRICDFVQGAVYSWCKNRPQEWFSMRDLMGGDNGVWLGTPLDALFQKHRLAGKSQEKAEKSAGIDSGWLLKRVLDSDRRDFDSKRAERITKYLWTTGA